MHPTGEEPLPPYVMMEIEELLGSLPEKLATLFWPRPWPKDEMMVMTRLIATETGVAGTCNDPVCRRSALCRAQAIGKDGPPCGASWVR